MSRVVRSLLVAVLVLAALAGASSQDKRSSVDVLTEENWDRMLAGEWMIEFYAPWCPACTALEPIWERMAFQKKELGINVGKVDVTKSPILSGRFMVTALPAIYHVKDGIFRQYKRPRDIDSLVEFVSKKIWTKVDPIPSWKGPTSIHMSIISQFFRMSQILRDAHDKLMDEYGIPNWGCYLIFAIVTIILGSIIGLLTVCIIDFIYPPPKSQAHLQAKTRQKGDSGGPENELSSGEDELIDNLFDDLVDEITTESEDKSENDKTDQENKSTPNSPNVRKRRSRKAD